MEKRNLIVFKNNNPEPIIVNVDGTTELHIVMRDIIGGWLENVHPKGLSEPYCMVVDEEGLLKGLNVNPIASELYNYDKDRIKYGALSSMISPIVGTVIILKEIYDNGERDWGTLNEDETKNVLNQIKALIELRLKLR